MNADDDKCEDHHTTLFAVVFCLIVKANMPLQAAIHTGQIRAELARKGTPVGPYDQMIAGHVRSRGLVVVTNNLREFERIPGIRIEDWCLISASDVIPGFKLFSGFSGTVSLVTCLMVVCITFLAGGIFLC